MCVVFLYTYLCLYSLFLVFRLYCVCLVLWGPQNGFGFPSVSQAKTQAKNGYQLHKKPPLHETGAPCPRDAGIQLPRSHLRSPLCSPPQGMIASAGNLWKLPMCAGCSRGNLQQEKQHTIGLDKFQQTSKQTIEKKTTKQATKHNNLGTYINCANGLHKPTPNLGFLKRLGGHEGRTYGLILIVWGLLRKHDPLLASVLGQESLFKQCQGPRVLHYVQFV